MDTIPTNALLIYGGVMTALLIALLVACFLLWKRFHALGASAGESLTEVVRKQRARIHRLERMMESCEGKQEELHERVMRKTERVPIIRYDAIPGLGGKQSFSIALLDEEKNGVILTVLALRDQMHSYAKRIERGKSERSLSDEERELLETISS